MSASISNSRRLGRGFVLSMIGALAFVTFIGSPLEENSSGTASMFVPQMSSNPVVTSDGRTIYVQKFEVTVAEWSRCHSAGACTLKIKAPGGAGEVNFPATGLNWFDVNEYLTWINRNQKTFRLPTAQEWDDMAREVMPEKADPIFTDPDLRWASAYLTAPQAKRRLRPSGSFRTTEEGIVDLNGSVWEWTSDCYAGADKGFDEKNCPAFFVGGEHIAAIPVFTRDPARGGCAVGSPPPHLGMRLVSDSPV